MTARRSARDHDEHIDFLGFAPDLDPNMPGACQEMAGVVPTLKGFRAAPTPDPTNRFQPLALGALHDATVVAGHYTQMRTLYVLGKAKVWQHSFSTTAVEVTGVLSGATNSEDIPMMLVEFGNRAYVASGSVTLAQQTSLNLAFTTIDGAPKPLLLTTADRFMLAFHNDNVNDSWRCSARDDASSWTANPATLATQGRLPDDDNDGFKAVATLGNEVIAFKSRRAYRGRFVPHDVEVWKWDLLPINKGALYGRSTANYRQGVAFLSADNLYYYDGASLTGLMDDRLAQWYAERVLSQQYRASIAVDELRDLVWISMLLYDDDSLTTYSRVTMMVHPPTKRWAKWNGTPLRALLSAPSVWPGSWDGGSARGDLRRVWAVKNLATTGDQMPRELAADATATATATITTNDFGHAFNDSELTRASLKFLTPPAAASVTHISRNALDGTLQTRGTIARAADGLFDVRQNARWHRLQFNLTGDFEVNGFAPEFRDTGKR